VPGSGLAAARARRPVRRQRRGAPAAPRGGSFFERQAEPVERAFHMPPRLAETPCAASSHARSSAKVTSGRGRGLGADRVMIGGQRPPAPVRADPANRLSRDANSSPPPACQKPVAYESHKGASAESPLSDSTHPENGLVSLNDWYTRYG